MKVFQSDVDEGWNNFISHVTTALVLPMKTDVSVVMSKYASQTISEHFYGDIWPDMETCLEVKWPWRENEHFTMYKKHAQFDELPRQLLETRTSGQKVCSS